MDHYIVWVNLAPGVDDLEFVAAVDAYLGELRREERIESWRILRRKLGFGPEGLGEFQITMTFRDLAQLDAAFERAATRDDQIEPLHAAVYSRVAEYRSALYRDFPDPVRRTGNEPGGPSYNQPG
jgi:hypothetical protein